MDDLALQVRHLDRVVVDQHQRSNARSSEVERRRRPQTTEADDECRRIEQRLLARHVELRQHDLPAVAKQLVVVHVAALCSAKGSVFSCLARAPTPNGHPWSAAIVTLRPSMSRNPREANSPATGLP